MFDDRWHARFGLREAVATMIACCLLAALIVPAIARARETSRKRQCVENLRALGVALHQYHEARGSLPPAAVWLPGGLNTLMLFDVKRIDRITHENWAQLLLPYLGRDDVAAKFDRRLPVMHQANEDARTTRLAEFTCPSDRFNAAGNFYAFQPFDDRPPLAEFARGNYAINGGTHSIKYLPESTTQPRGESMQVVLDHDRRLFKAIGTGIAGINHSFRLSDFANGQSTLAAIDEIRAGVHSLDMRGAWALGQVGSSITCAHGVVGDDGGPNNQWDRSDDILGCGRLHKALGSDRLEALRMPCAWYVDHSQEATARSQHPGGVHVLFVDGAVRFVGDEVDRGLWHVIHSRETPAAVLDHIDENLWGGRPSLPGARDSDSLEARTTSEPASEKSRVNKKPGGERLTNSLGMRFVAIPAGTFLMGVPDKGNDGPAPPECPTHEVTITDGFWLGEHEVTQAQFQGVMERKPSHQADDGDSAGDFPVAGVTWYEADEFCRRLSELPDEVAAGREYRLPTEAEWEYACRSGNSEPYRWRAQRAQGDRSGAAAGIEPALPLAKVGSYAPNAFGLYDMRGNVWEWCADWFDRDYYAHSPHDNPRGPDHGYLKVVRGSDWIFVGEICRINYPIMSPWRKSEFVGFRVVCEVNRRRQVR